MPHFQEIKIKDAFKYALERYPFPPEGIEDVNSVVRHAYKKGYIHGYENAVLKADRLLKKANIDFDIINAIYRDDEED